MAIANVACYRVDECSNLRVIILKALEALDEPDKSLGRQIFSDQTIRPIAKKESVERSMEHHDECIHRGRRTASEFVGDSVIRPAIHSSGSPSIRMAEVNRSVDT